MLERNKNSISYAKGPKGQRVMKCHELMKRLTLCQETVLSHLRIRSSLVQPGGPTIIRKVLGKKQVPKTMDMGLSQILKINKTWMEYLQSQKYIHAQHSSQQSVQSAA